jgi:hypothetical protein
MSRVRSTTWEKAHSLEVRAAEDCDKVNDREDLANLIGTYYLAGRLYRQARDKGAAETCKKQISALYSLYNPLI